MMKTMTETTVNFDEVIKKQYHSNDDNATYLLTYSYQGGIKHGLDKFGCEYNIKHGRWTISSTNPGLYRVRKNIIIFLKTAYQDSEILKQHGISFDGGFKCYIISQKRFDLLNETAKKIVKNEISDQDFSWLSTSTATVTQDRARIEKLKDKSKYTTTQTNVNASLNKAFNTAVATVVENISVDGYTLLDIGRAVAKMLSIHAVNDDKGAYSFIGKLAMSGKSSDGIPLICQIDKNYKHIHIDTEYDEHILFLLNSFSNECEEIGSQLFVHHNETCYTLHDGEVVEAPLYKNQFPQRFTFAEEDESLLDDQDVVTESANTIPTRNPGLWENNVKNLPLPGSLQVEAKYQFSDPDEKILAAVELAAYDLYDPQYGVFVDDIADKLDMITSLGNRRKIRNCLHYLRYHVYQRELSHHSDPSESKREYWWKFR